ncbi:hypothetical protein AWZ03_002354 [Drosophila navojoa]|uniref:Uncharacterized protein n=1 Tax=Drosophila navojoa TaxID=7232 RepID=A0A484BR58_DRONA|nr:hypothetical protein AWZ03_002354 [Drosophila navojoa]
MSSEQHAVQSQSQSSSGLDYGQKNLPDQPLKLNWLEFYGCACCFCFFVVLVVVMIVSNSNSSISSSSSSSFSRGRTTIDDWPRLGLGLYLSDIIHLPAHQQQQQQQQQQQRRLHNACQ